MMAVIPETTVTDKTKNIFHQNLGITVENITTIKYIHCACIYNTETK